MAWEGKAGEKKNQQITRGPRTKSDEMFYCQVDDEREGGNEQKKRSANAGEVSDTGKKRTEKEK